MDSRRGRDVVRPVEQCVCRASEARSVAERLPGGNRSKWIGLSAVCPGHRGYDG
jgi:hypothetical protein